MPRLLKRGERAGRESRHRRQHAVAFERGITLLTADDHYYRKASHLGNMMALSDWPPKPAAT